MSRPSDNHLSAEEIQAFLEGEMPGKALVDAEEHLASCRRCSVELEAWQTLFQDLEGLSTYRPHEGFHERVMSGVVIPEPRSLVERLRDQLAAAFAEHEGSHVPGSVLQDFLEGSLAARRAHRIEEHLTRCDACTREADVWLGIMRRLDDLGTFSPGEGFADAVMSRVTIPEQVSLAARIRRKIDGLLGSAPVPEHVPAGLLQDLVDGALPPTAVARVRAHVDGCHRCAGELASWQAVATRLEGLGRLEPAEGFVDHVMTGLQEARASRKVTRRPPAWTRALAAARRAAAGLLPEARQAVAALAGAAVTPMVILGVALWSLWSHPTLTMGSLASFLWWQVRDGAETALGGLSAVVTQGDWFGLYALLDIAASAPAMVAAGAVAYTTVCALALRVLYKNLYANRSTHERYAHVSTAS
ncbi:MAG: zf-HC2 domain-containing protein [Longimicrobiales bacterium]|nr:zf-HC2 domain-containing protein [Longimicrobiales bacterium]